MVKKIFLVGTFLTGLTLLSYPSQKENVGVFNYCYAFEKIVSRNIFKKNDIPNWIKSLSGDVLNVWADTSRGTSIRKAIAEENISYMHPQVNCLIWYWYEKFEPGFFSYLIQKELTSTLKDEYNKSYQDIKKHTIILIEKLFNLE